jgi:hypothetical protein
MCVTAQSTTYLSARDISLSSSSPSNSFSLLLVLEMLWTEAILMLSLLEAVLSFWLGDDRSSVLLLEPDLPIHNYTFRHD